MIHGIFIINNHGKARLIKVYNKVVRDLCAAQLKRSAHPSSLAVAPCSLRTPRSLSASCS